MIFKFLSHRKILNFRNVRASTKVWKVQIKLPCGFCLIKENENVVTTSLIICQVLN
jgi:hypothetical protein